MTSNAVNTILLTRELIRCNSNIYFTCDKGNRKGNKNLAKFIFWYDKQDKKVEVFLLDANCTDEDISEIS